MPHDTAIARLRNLLGDRLSTSEAIRDHHGQNESYYPVTLPDAVAFPETTEEVSGVMRICHEEGCPVVAWGTGTSLEGHALAFHGGITLDLSRMDKVLAVHDEDLDATIQPGVTREALNTELRATGLFFPIDPGANASLGGMAATRASGTTAVRYGTMKDNVLALEVVLADGRVIRTGSRARKSSAGYDLTRLIVGSEGTLGIITELTVKLHGQPEAISSAICAFEDIETAVSAVQMVIQMGIPVARIEFVDSISIRGFNVHAGTAMPEKPHLFLEFHGSESAVAEQAERVGEIVAEFGGGDFQWTNKPEERNALWHMRHNAYYASKALRPGCWALTTDVCVPISRLAEAVAVTRADIDASSLEATILGHVGDGNYHCAILIDPDSPAELAEAKELAHRMNTRALEMGGTVTGEHGVGLGKMKYMDEEHGAAWAVMAEIKRALDPTNILNPGKMVQVN
ncbi:FAD-binding oxidoreductase [Oceanicella sp. SM1341]|uniref:FAD-binding oxidoreductase n=1 Tax=Oceanicella sp. SM1341 TaxID=1548889 RepID=UPI000E4A2087|nr:FAD-linked oxidase C-terminal domain-containing protein [Oceanicella sp. SM1341]